MSLLFFQDFMSVLSLFSRHVCTWSVFRTSCLFSVLRTPCLYSVSNSIRFLFVFVFVCFSGCHVTTFFQDIMSLLGLFSGHVSTLFLGLYVTTVFRGHHVCTQSVFKTCLYSVCFQDILSVLSLQDTMSLLCFQLYSVYFQDIMSLLSLLSGRNVSAQSVFEDIMSLLGLFSGHHVTTPFPGHHVSTWSVFRTSCLCSVCFQDIMLYEKKQNNWATHSLWQGLDRSLRKGVVTTAAAVAGGVWVGQLFNSAVSELWTKNLTMAWRRFSSLSLLVCEYWTVSNSDMTTCKCTPSLTARPLTVRTMGHGFV